MVRIVTSYGHKPIPWRCFDWTAWNDVWGADASPCGRGATEAEAIADLERQLSEMQEGEKRCGI